MIVLLADVTRLTLSSDANTHTHTHTHNHNNQVRDCRRNSARHVVPNSRGSGQLSALDVYWAPVGHTGIGHVLRVGSNSAQLRNRIRCSPEFDTPVGLGQYHPNHGHGRKLLPVRRLSKLLLSNFLRHSLRTSSAEVTWRSILMLAPVKYHSLLVERLPLIIFLMIRLRKRKALMVNVFVSFPRVQ